MTQPAPDPALVAAALAGDAAARARLVAAWTPAVLGWCVWLAPSGVDPEDAAHDALLAALDGLPRLRDPAAFPAWLFTAVRRSVARHARWAWLRRAEPLPNLADPGPDPAEEAARRAARREVRIVLATLAARDREILVLCLLEERSRREAAGLLGLPEGTVQHRLEAARLRFRRALARQRRRGIVPEEDP
ncbi:MAG: sigma-70 family RNA polymerase sigma factor [Pseudomonadota bacterium]